MFGGELVMIHCGGATLNNDYEKFFSNIGIDIFNGYGISECSGPVTCNSIEYYREGSVGNINGTNCRQVKIENKEILVRGPIVFKTYYDESLNNNAFKDGWFRTGDLGMIDEDGYLYITGRIKNLIILPNGENVSPEELERIILQSDYIKEALVHTKKNKLGIEVLGVVVIPNLHGFDLLKHDIYDKIYSFINKVNLSLSNYKRLKFIDINDTDIEKNEIGKIKRS